jgi:hypothetical protein
MQKNTEVLLLSSKEIVISKNAEKTTYKFISHEENVGQIYNTEISERVANFRYLGKVITNQNCIHKEINGTLNSEKMRQNSNNLEQP